MIVKAYVILKPGFAGDAALTRALQDYVKATIAPYKYPRAIEFVDLAAAHRDRQAATLRAPPHRLDRRRQQTRVVIRSHFPLAGGGSPAVGAAGWGRAHFTAIG